MVFVNDWIWASKREREKMDARIIKSMYRVGRNVFFILGFMFLTLSIYCLFLFSWLLYIMFALGAIVAVYAIVQYIMGERLSKSIANEK